MSTRRYLRERRRGLNYLSSKDPKNSSLKRAVAELDFILEKLKEYDIQKSETTRVC